MFTSLLPLQAAQSEAPAERYQRELRHVGVLPALAGPSGREQVPDGPEEPVRPGHRGKHNLGLNFGTAML